MPETCRALRKQVRRARNCLRSSGRQLGVHETRQRITKAHALLGLLRYTLGQNSFHKRDELLHRAARSLGKMRDGQILIENLDMVLLKYRAARSLRDTGKLRNTLRREQRDNCSDLGKRHAPQRSKRLLRRAAKSLPHRSRRQSTLLKGLRRAYSEGRDALDVAQSEPTDRALHSLRKKTKVLALQLRWMAEQAHVPLRGTSQAFHRLSDTLGGHHDLALLQQRVADGADSLRDLESRTRLIALIEQRSIALRRQALLQAARLCRPKRSQFVRWLAAQ